MNVQEAINTRYSSRALDPNKKIPDAEMDLIVEAGFKAPNGLGLEAWKFIVCDGNKEKLMMAAYNQKHIGEGSHVIAILGYTDAYLRAHKEILDERFEMMGLDSDHKAMYEKKIYGMDNISEYIYPQTHIAAGYIALQATELGIGTVIVGGFDRKEVAAVLGIDTEIFEVSLLVSLGYSLDKQPKVRKHREINDLVGKITLK